MVKLKIVGLNSRLVCSMLSSLSGDLTPHLLPIWALIGHKGSVKHVSLCLDHEYLVTGGDDSTAILWNTHGRYITSDQTSRKSTFL